MEPTASEGAPLPGLASAIWTWLARILRLRKSARRALVSHNREKQLSARMARPKGRTSAPRIEEKPRHPSQKKLPSTSHTPASGEIPSADVDGAGSATRAVPDAPIERVEPIAPVLDSRAELPAASSDIRFPATPTAAENWDAPSLVEGDAVDDDRAAAHFSGSSDGDWQTLETVHQNVPGPAADDFSGELAKQDHHSDSVDDEAPDLPLPGNGECDQSAPLSGRSSAISGVPIPAAKSRTPRKYRPRLAPRVSDKRPTQPPTDAFNKAGAARGPLDAELVVAFQPGGWGIQLALLLRRAPDMPEYLPILFGPDGRELCAIASDLYEPFAVSDPQTTLAEGIAVEAVADAEMRWVRGGRSLHVFTGRSGVAGFVSAARLVIGQENAVLCSDEVADRVLQACTAAGSPNPTEVVGPGVPSGWRCLRGIRPSIAPAPSAGAGILLALVPLPDAAIDLCGGISVSRSAWLAGHPPSIRILGACPSPPEVSIDGQPAACAAEGGWMADGWDAPGSHIVCYAGLSRTYENLSRTQQMGTLGRT